MFDLILHVNRIEIKTASSSQQQPGLHYTNESNNKEISLKIKNNLMQF